MVASSWFSSAWEQLPSGHSSVHCSSSFNRCSSNRIRWFKTFRFVWGVPTVLEGLEGPGPAPYCDGTQPFKPISKGWMFAWWKVATAASLPSYSWSYHIPDPIVPSLNLECLLSHPRCHPYLQSYPTEVMPLNAAGPWYTHISSNFTELCYKALQICNKNRVVSLNIHKRYGPLHFYLGKPAFYHPLPIQVTKRRGSLLRLRALFKTKEKYLQTPLFKLGDTRTSSSPWSFFSVIEVSTFKSTSNFFFGIHSGYSPSLILLSSCSYREAFKDFSAYSPSLINFLLP